MSYASILSKNLEKSPSRLNKLPEEKILLVVDLFKLSELDIRFGTPHFDAISSLTIIQRAYKYFVLHKNRYHNNQFAICLLTPLSYDLILDFTADVKVISKELLLIPTTINITEEIAAYDFRPFLKFVAQLRSNHKDSIFRVIMSYNRDDCLPIIDSLDENSFSIFSSPSFFFDIVYICQNNLEMDEMAQNIYGKLALLCNPWSYKICTQRKPMAIMNGISSLLHHPFVRSNPK